MKNESLESFENEAEERRQIYEIEKILAEFFGEDQVRRVNRVIRTNRQGFDDSGRSGDESSDYGLQEMRAALTQPQNERLFSHEKEEVVPEALSKQLSYIHIAETIEKRFRTQFTDPPENEKEVQEQLRKFLDAQGYEKGKDYERESGNFQFAGREYIPDFVIKNLGSVIEVKLLKDRNKKSKMIEEMNADCNAYTKEYNSIIFLVYDLGVISDIEEFRRDFESKGNVRVVVIKH